MGTKHTALWPQIVPSRTCLSCDVCCRFPEPDSFLRPWFTAEEITKAVARGIDRKHFPDSNGSQVHVVPHPTGDGYLCPAFDPATSHCRIYEDRPLDCQLYPLAIMKSEDGREVVLGWDAKCPYMRDELPSEIVTHAKRVFGLLERDETVELLAQNPRLIGRFQEDVVILRMLPKLTARLGGMQAGTAHPFTVAERVRLEAACGLVDTPLAHYAAPPHLLWKDLFRYVWTEIAGTFCLFAEYADGVFMPLPPLSARPNREAFASAFALMRARNHGRAVSRIENVPEEWTTPLGSWGYHVKPKDPDYLYKTVDLVALAGDKYKSQRAACNRLEREHAVQMLPFQNGDREACLVLFRAWSQQKQTKGLNAFGQQLLTDSEAAHREALTHHRELGLVGWVVKFDGQVRAYTFGYVRSASVFCVLLEVADRSVHGLSAWIFREHCRAAAERGQVFINTMDDSGLLTLAQSKRAYHPIQLVASYIVTEA